MKRFLTLVLMLCVGLCAGCAQNQQPDPQKPENGTLTAEELEEFQAMFTPGSCQHLSHRRKRSPLHYQADIFRGHPP